MKHLILTLFGILIFLVIGNAKSLDKVPDKNLISRNRIFTEIIGVPNTFISINYERVLFTSQKSSFELTTRTGFGYSYHNNYNSHLYSVPLELNGLIGGEILKLDVGISYVKQYRTEITKNLGSGIFNSGKGSFYHYSLRVGCRINMPTDDNQGFFLRMSLGKNFTQKKLIRNYSGDESSSSKLIVSGLFGLSFGYFF